MLKNTVVHGLGHGEVCCVGRPVESSLLRLGRFINALMLTGEVVSACPRMTLEDGLHALPLLFCRRLFYSHRLS